MLDDLCQTEKNEVKVVFLKKKTPNYVVQLVNQLDLHPVLYECTVFYIRISLLIYVYFIAS